jgi:YD repeat-containing protein
MKPRLFPAALLALAALSALPGQEEDSTEGASGLFPLGILLDAAVSGESPWSPEWPAALPPDGFAPGSGRVSALTLVLPAGYLDAPPGGEDAAAGTAEEETAVEYRLVRDGAGRCAEFPFFVNGALYQAQAEYDGAGARRITLDNPAAPDPWECEILEYRDGKPALARISHGGSWHFVAQEYLETRTNETWSDAEGLAQGFCSLEYRLENGARRLASIDSRSDQDASVLVYDYNSAGLVSGISTGGGNYTALYNAGARPRYRELPGEAYTLQWNEQGLLTRITGTAGDETAPEAEPRRIDIRYDYVLDGRGNWIERRETSFDRRFGRLVPRSETAIRRSISYGDDGYDAGP